ncbi:MAG TPA: bifunctional glutamate N-acetyltransferase/amino-acid acetyltransferase ArgJ [Deltaproteobacteria bacterium]|nr:bifunctional glutamate N-acetyltransferase/amino-acid acetyltransferase ArgJ [Deltaproteobacteria bacterium]
MTTKKNLSPLKVPGFRAGGVACGIKGNGKKDLAIIVSEEPAAAAAVFTTNRFKAAPVVHDMNKITSGKAQAVFINSGSANAATGEEGDADAGSMAEIAAKCLRIDSSLVLVASTGSIGSRLPMDKIAKGAPLLADGLNGEEDGLMQAAEAITTTDRFIKTAGRRFTIDGKDVSLCGIAKGAGMIEPDMATMLAFFMTDAAIEQSVLSRMFKKAVDQSFNTITVDGCMSTNDTALILANGRAGNRPLQVRSANGQIFLEALLETAIELAAMIVRDGEGATKLIDITVDGARNRTEARRIAYAVGRSNLVKTAFFGGDANWGRIISAAGSVGIPIDPRRLTLYFEDCLIFTHGQGVGGNEKKLREIMKRDTVSIRIKLAEGSGTFRVFASDLTHDYVDINALYHT